MIVDYRSQAKQKLSTLFSVFFLRVSAVNNCIPVFLSLADFSFLFYYYFYFYSILFKLFSELLISLFGIYALRKAFTFSSAISMFIRHFSLFHSFVIFGADHFLSNYERGCIMGYFEFLFRTITLLHNC